MRNEPGEVCRSLCYLGIALLTLAGSLRIKIVIALTSGAHRVDGWEQASLGMVVTIRTWRLGYQYYRNDFVAGSSMVKGTSPRVG